MAVVRFVPGERAVGIRSRVRSAMPCGRLLCLHCTELRPTIFRAIAHKLQNRWQESLNRTRLHGQQHRRAASSSDEHAGRQGAACAGIIEEVASPPRPCARRLHPRSPPVRPQSFSLATGTLRCAQACSLAARRRQLCCSACLCCSAARTMAQSLQCAISAHIAAFPCLRGGLMGRPCSANTTAGASSPALVSAARFPR